MAVSTLELTADVVASYVASHEVPIGDLPALLRSVHSALSGQGESGEQPSPSKPTPVEIRRSVTPDYLVSFEDQRSYKMLKRHLTLLGITPAQYRQKWGLPPDYPMVSRNYSSTRSALAKSMGLGRKVVKKSAARRKAPATKPRS